jgi:drug/metabolite transporter (DMT)-like permease
MGILFGLIAALCWGAADFIAGRVSRLVGVIQTMFYVQLVALVCTSALIILRPGAPAPHISAWVLAGAIALGNFIGTLLLYRAFAVGTLAIVSPIASGFAVVTALLSLAAGERPAPLTLTGALLLIGGVVVVSRTPQGQEVEPRIENREPSVVSAQFFILNSALPAGVPEALGVTVCFGGALWALGFVTPSLGMLWPLLVTRAIETLGALLLLLGRKAAPARLSRKIWPLVSSAALLDTVAFLAFTTGIGSTYTSIVTALASLFSAVTVLLAWVILRERLTSIQWAGVGVILAGVLLVSL